MNDEFLDPILNWIGDQMGKPTQKEDIVSDAKPDGVLSVYPDRTRVRHFKGGEYAIICHASHCDTGQGLVIYKCARTGFEWARPMDEFYGMVDGRPRFEAIE